MLPYLASQTIVVVSIELTPIIITILHIGATPSIAKHRMWTIVVVSIELAPIIITIFHIGA